MNVARHHAEWLNLVETTGPFLSMPVLMRVFPQGLDKRDTRKASELREAYEEWLEHKDRAAVHLAWVRHVLTQFLEYPADLLAEGQAIPAGLEAKIALFGETLRPDFVLKHRDAGGAPQLLICVYPAGQSLEKPVTGKTWQALAGTRMMELLRTCNLPLGLATNGEQWMLVHVCREETTGFSSWYADLWMQEPVTLQAFESLLHLRRFLGVATAETLSELYAASLKDQQEVTIQLGQQVRRAVEMLVQEFDRCDADGDRRLLAGLEEKTIYDAALTVMMRLVFLFAAEERRMLLLGDPLFDEHYAVSTLCDLLRQKAEQDGEELLQRRSDAWCRLLATFRAVHGGVEHESMRLPAYGGTLFDPDRYPFLEGRAAGTHWRETAARPMPVNNRVVLHLLEALQFLKVKVPGGGKAEARRLSFQALGIEQIGHVYEGLLDHTARRAGEIVLGLTGTKGEEPEIPLSKLESLTGQDSSKPIEFPSRQEDLALVAENARDEVRLSGQGREVVYDEPPAALMAFLRETTGRSENSLKKALNARWDDGGSQLYVACGQDQRLLERVRPFAGLLRQDDFDRPMVIQEGSVYVTSGADRRSTGTHYTPRSLTEPIVKHTLDPLVFVGPADGKPEGEWQLRTAKEILDIKVCDMAMGSGAFLVQACRYLAERLMEAWAILEKAHPDEFIVTPDGRMSTGDPTERLLPADGEERTILARRSVADRCLYGVDINPMAVEMAKLSLWLVTLQKDRPFTFLDHAVKCGDSLLGVNKVSQIDTFRLRPGTVQHTFATINLFRYVEDAAAKRRALEALPSETHDQLEQKKCLHAEAEAATKKVKAIADILIALELRGLSDREYDKARETETERIQGLLKRDAEHGTVDRDSVLVQAATDGLSGRRAFHWPVEFPEVFQRGGFDAFVGNPPFMHGSWISSTFGDQYAAFLREVTRGAVGKIDFAVYFLRRAASHVIEGRTLGLVVTSKIKEGAARSAGYDALIQSEWAIYFAISDLPWPGTAGVIVSCVCMIRGAWRGERLLNDRKVQNIDSRLEANEEELRIAPLAVNSGTLYLGAKPDSLGFTLTPSEARSFLTDHLEYRTVIRPYFSGTDLNDYSRLEAPRFIIDFSGMTLEEANNYPELLRIIEREVMPSRMKLKREAYRDRWWQFTEPQKVLFDKIRQYAEVLALCRVSKHFAIRFVPTEAVYSDSTVVFVRHSMGDFAVLSSSLHNCWAVQFSGTHGSGTPEYKTYKPATSGAAFPFPPLALHVDDVGKRYHMFRHHTMVAHGAGLTGIYNRFHDPAEKSEDITRLRALHVEMDQAVAATYGWTDLDLGHGFHETKQGIRYTISETARRTVLDRLLALNHERYEEEVKAGLHDKKAKGRRLKAEGKRKKAGMVREEGAEYGSAQPELFGVESSRKE